MNKIIVSLFLIFIFVSTNVQSQCPESFHDFSALDIDSNLIHMSSFSGKKVLVVNTASFCGYTHQYASLQQLYNTYGGPGNPYNFEIIGFPANNFNNQEPYDEDSIAEVCNSYGVTFTMMSKISVKAPNQHEIYQWLTQQSRNCVQNAPVTWNFQKYMINPDGTWHATATPATSPLHSSIVNWITSSTSLDENKHKEHTSFNIYASAYDKIIHLNFKVEEAQQLNIRLFNVNGQLINTIFEGEVNSNFEFVYPAPHIKAGIYIIEVSGSSFRKHQKLTFF